MRIFLKFEISHFAAELQKSRSQKIGGFLILLFFIANSSASFFNFLSEKGEESNKNERRQKGQAYFSKKKNREEFNLGKKRFKQQIRMTAQVTRITTYFMPILKGNHRDGRCLGRSNFSLLYVILQNNDSRAALRQSPSQAHWSSKEGAVNLMSRNDTKHLPRADHLGLQDFSLQKPHNM